MILGYINDSPLLKHELYKNKKLRKQKRTSQNGRSVVVGTIGWRVVNPTQSK
ncbi:hypothetical protein LEP1GSC199_2923 [Leptospira vanthielii serovar Holland str. Waz Holland = ATCC 700522]|uniref:Uncharacterized protein n=1 Tax=Leptospira vanthielii serovar Holland str. Waz Holland = ATCC 700522 TaxID=1218591 RepID=N1W960_9LEPT|nr:hypothetical protein LEP1GSC199_2923 [Leptospira vanthielii serovar Holland str. Waz Holland = ATCC 700522]